MLKFLLICLKNLFRIAEKDKELMNLKQRLVKTKSMFTFKIFVLHNL